MTILKQYYTKNSLSWNNETYALKSSTTYEMLLGNAFKMFQVHFTLPFLPSCEYYTIHRVEKCY